MNRLAITRVELNRKNFIAYISSDEKRDFIDFKLYPDDKEHLVGAVYIGRVEHVVSNIQASFVKISPTQKCFLPLSLFLPALRAVKSYRLCLSALLSEQP